MEEFVGALWNRIVTRAARRDYPEAAVGLGEIEKMLGVLFRALGGDAGLRVTMAAEQRHGARRRLLERIAGSGERSPRSALDGATLRLPERIALFARRELNRDLYLWLVAAAAHQPAPCGDAWIVRNQIATLRALSRYPGLRLRYERLVAEVLAGRIDPAAMPADEAAQEQAVRQALLQPGSVSSLPPLMRSKARKLQAVPLWIYPAPDMAPGAAASAHAPRAEGGGSRAQESEAERKRYQAQRTETPDNESPLLLPFRAESILSWAEYVKVNRALDDDENPDAARTAANMDQLSVAADNGERVASRVRFDLDLPSAAEDDAPLGEGIALPEWDHRRRELKPDYCRLQRLVARGAVPLPLPEHLRRPARKLRNQFAALAHARRWQKAQPDGSEIDIDACVRLHADRLAGRHQAGGAYMSLKRQERDLACLVLADLSLSTDAWVSDSHRIIDVIRDSLMLFGEALSATGDRFGFYGFSSLKRGNVRFHEIKDFACTFDSAARGRIAALKPGYYTRMGAAIRHASTVLCRQPAAQRLLLMLSDGKPHDMDLYEGRYGIEDTRKSLLEARILGIRPFCVTIDRHGADYLAHMYGTARYAVLDDVRQLPLKLADIYQRLST